MELLKIPDDEDALTEERSKRVSVKSTSHKNQLGYVFLFAARVILLGCAIYALLRRRMCEYLVNQVQIAALLAVSAVNCTFDFASTVYNIYYRNYTAFIAVAVGLVLQEATAVIFERYNCTLHEFRCYCWVNWSAVVVMLLAELWRIAVEPNEQSCDL